MIANELMELDEMLLFRKTFSAVASSLDMEYKMVDILESDIYELKEFKTTDGTAIVLFLNIDEEYDAELNNTIKSLYNKIYLTGKGCTIKNKIVNMTTGYSHKTDFVTILSMIKALFPFSSDMDIMSHFFTVLLFQQAKQLGGN